MDRIIEIKVNGNYITKDNKNAGVRGEGNVTNLRITFDEGWDKYSKTVTFFDAYGQNPVKRVETVDLLEDRTKDIRTYITPIPPEALAVEGELTFVIDGYYEKIVDGVVVERKRQRSVSDKLVVKYSPDTDNAGEPTDPTPEPYEQLQGQIDAIKGDIQGAATARDEAKASAQSAGTFMNNARIYSYDAFTYSQFAQNAVGKTSYIGENGNWYAWDSYEDKFYDTGVKAQAGSMVYVGDNPPEGADVWLDPNGEASEILPATKDLTEDSILTAKAYPTLQGTIQIWEDRIFIMATGINTEYGFIKFPKGARCVFSYAEGSTATVKLYEDFYFMSEEEMTTALEQYLNQVEGVPLGTYPATVILPVEKKWESQDKFVTPDELEEVIPVCDSTEDSVLVDKNIEFDAELLMVLNSTKEISFRVPEEVYVKFPYDENQLGYVVPAGCVITANGVSETINTNLLVSYGVCNIAPTELCSQVQVGDIVTVTLPIKERVWVAKKNFVTAEQLLELANKVAPTPASVTLYADRWEQDEEDIRYHQEVVVANATITNRSKVDLQLSAEQITIFYEKDLAFVAENDSGVVTVYCIGQVPENDYVIQATVSEVIVNA